MELTEKLKLLEENIKILQEIKAQISLAELKRNRRYEWEIRYGLFESIQIVVDIACKLASKYNLGNPKSYRACIELLQQHNYLDETIALKAMSMVGLRNLLVHEYVKIDDAELYRFLDSLEDFMTFAKQIERHL